MFSGVIKCILDSMLIVSINHVFFSFFTIFLFVIQKTIKPVFFFFHNKSASLVIHAHHLLRVQNDKNVPPQRNTAANHQCDCGKFVAEESERRHNDRSPGGADGPRLTPPRFASCVNMASIRPKFRQ